MKAATNSPISQYQVRFNILRQLLHGCFVRILRSEKDLEQQIKAVLYLSATSKDLPDFLSYAGVGAKRSGDRPFQPSIDLTIILNTQGDLIGFPSLFHLNAG